MTFPGMQDETATRRALSVHAEAKARSNFADNLALLKRLDRYYDSHPGAVRLDLRIAIKRAAKG